MHVTAHARTAHAVLLISNASCPAPLCLQVTKLVQEEAIVTQWFSNHHFPLSKLREMTLRDLGRPLELVKAATTRFGTHTLRVL